MTLQRCRRRSAWKGLLALIRLGAIQTIRGSYETVEGVPVFELHIAGPKINIKTRLFKAHTRPEVSSAAPDKLYRLLEEFLQRPKRAIWLFAPLLKRLSKREKYAGKISVVLEQYDREGERFVGMFFYYSSTRCVGEIAAERAQRVRSYAHA